MKRLPILAALIVGVLSLTLAMPQSAFACSCAGSFPGDVQFVGTATDGPDEGWFTMFDGSPGVYTFTVDEVALGDPGDGRVFTPAGYGGCGRRFEMGAQYTVHAEVIDPAGRYMSYSPGVPLVTTICLQGGQIRPAPQGLFDSLGAFPLLGGLVLLAGALVGVVYRRRVVRSWE